MIDYKNIKKILDNSGVIIYPTKSLYGLGCKFDSKEAIERIYTIKNRRDEKPFLLLVGSYEMARKIVSINKKQEEFLKEYWPGHLTVIFNSLDNKKTIAIRYPDTLFLNKLFKEIDYPIVSTSVNKSGEEPYDITKIKNLLSNNVDLIIDLPISKEGKASTIIDFTKEKPIIIRKGELKIDLKEK